MPGVLVGHPRREYLWRYYAQLICIVLYYIVETNFINDQFCCQWQESAHPELERNKSKDIKTKGVQTDLPLNSGHLERKKVLMNNISSNLCAIWGRPANSMLGRSLISKILVSCSEEMLTLFQSARLPDKCETSTEASSSMNNAISEVYDIIVKVMVM